MSSTNGIGLSAQLTEDRMRAEIDHYVDSQLAEYQHIKVTNPKVIHDSVHGTNLFHPYEIAFLDLPIVQRLRRISQIDVASLVFPAGNHNRFEHTVGVTVVAGQMVDSIFPKCSDLLTGIDKEYIYHNCRVAAILHDCGHGPFSHLSEQLYSAQLKEVRQNNAVLAGASAHEILSYFIVTSNSLKEYNDSVIKKEYGIDIDLDFVGEMIVGYIDREVRREYGFAIEIINGAFDADKLDYILRDAHVTGVRMALDLPRLMYTLNVIKDTNNVIRLAIDISGVAALEEIVFNKMMLTSAIYHHQKVRSAGCMLKGIIEECGLFADALDYLKFTDDMVYGLLSDNLGLMKQLNMFRNRSLPKRAFCFSRRTLVNSGMLNDIMSMFEDVEFRKDIITVISQHIEESTGHYIPENEIWLDSPQNPKFKEATQCIIKSVGSDNGYITLRDVFPTDDWVRAFSENKWRGFVYTLPENCNYVAEASKYVFEEVFQTEFNSYATELCKIADNTV